MIIRGLNTLLGKMGYSITRNSSTVPIDLQTDTAFLRLYEKCRPYTQTSMERLYSLYQACLYVVDNKLEGDFVECGVWRGGSSMMMALALQTRGVTDRKIYLYDTYEGMSEPTAFDVAVDGVSASNKLTKEKKEDADSIWCYASFEEVLHNMRSTGYPVENIRMIKGKVEDTLPNECPGSICLLRLDTDWYESTKIELEMMYPRLVKQGILIIDDFGHWEGARKAVIEYFAAQPYHPLLNRIDITGRISVKV